MSQHDKLIAAVLTGRQDANVRFAELCGLLEAFGFDQRVKGSHHIYFRPDVQEILNLQPGDGAKAKPYQVRQVQ